MSYNKNSLALRDAALAVLVGAIDGADFGAVEQADFGQDFGYDFGEDYDHSGADFGVGFGSRFGVDAGSMQSRLLAGRNVFSPSALAAASGAADAAAQSAGAPDHSTLVSAWQAHRRTAAVTQSRASLLHPNADSTINVERYAFSMNANLTLGTVSACSCSNNPDTTIRPQRVTMNAPSPGFVTVSELKVANVSVTIGGIDDAWSYNANGVGQSLDMPTLTPANRASMIGNYSGFTPPGFVAAQPYLFAVSFKGPATIDG